MEIGSLLGNRYRILEKVGSGGMASVYRARDTMLERDVALKVLHEVFSEEEDFRERFRQEARAAANLSHPNIVTVYDFGFDEGQLFIVMEYVPGADLKTIIRRRGRFDVKSAIAIMVQACAGIGYAHRAGLVHCDVKPHNFLVTPDERVKVTDFGIARALSSIRTEEQSDVVWGSPQYIAPEQAAGYPPSPASDVYSLGVILYELLSGTLPFMGSTPEELARLHLEAKPIPLSEYVPEIPPALEQIVEKVLSKEPSARYRTADQLGRVLLRFGTEETPSAAKVISTPIAAPFTEEPPAPSGSTQPIPRKAPVEIDWVTVLLSLLALIAVGGLIPFWMWVYFVYNPPIR